MLSPERRLPYLAQETGATKGADGNFQRAAVLVTDEREVVMNIRKSGVIGLALSIAVSAALAQPAQTRRIAGTVEKADGGTLVVKPHSGDAVTIHLADQVAVYGVSKGAMTDLKPNAYVGVGGMPQADGSQRAMQIVVFAENQRGTGEGFRPWDRGPTSTMTNGTVDTHVASVDGPKLVVKYKGGEQTIIVPSDAVILAYSVGETSELKPGAHVAVIGAKPRADGTLDADRVNVGRGEIVPR
jgi:hypothetical protein